MKFVLSWKANKDWLYSQLRKDVKDNSGQLRSKSILNSEMVTGFRINHTDLPETPAGSSYRR